MAWSSFFLRLRTVLGEMARLLAIVALHIQASIGATSCKMTLLVAQLAGSVVLLRLRAIFAGVTLLTTVEANGLLGSFIFQIRALERKVLFGPTRCAECMRDTFVANVVVASAAITRGV